jgi:pimeloyl-ACP methyl ester carboxylesterase
MPYVQTNGIQLYYEEKGKGEPLLLIMGITAAGSVWQKHVDYWQRYFRCIVVDNRGVGLSDKPIGSYSTEQMADDFAGLLEKLSVSPVHVVGCSMGSTIAQQLALRHPARVRSLVLMCTWARCDRMATTVFEHLKNIKSRLPASEFIQYIQLLIYSKKSFDDDTLYQEMLVSQLDAADQPEQPAHAMEAQADACITHNTLARLPGLTLPTLVIGGEEDIFTPAWMSREVAEAIPRSRLHLYPHSGHAFHWENLEDFNNRVVEWCLVLR